MSTVNYNEDMRKAFPDKELKQPKKQNVVVENNNMEDDSMEQVNKLFGLYNEAFNNDNDEDMDIYEAKLNKLGYAIDYNKETQEFILVELNNNNEEEVVMENNVAVIKCDNIESIVNEIFAPFVEASNFNIIDNQVVLNNDIDPLLSTLIAYELDYREQNMKESYPNLVMNNLIYDRRFAKAKCAIFPAYTESRMERYEEAFEGLNFVKFSAYDEVKELACVHYVVYDLPIGKKAELKKAISTQNKIAKTVNKGVSIADKTLTATAFTVKQLGTLAQPVGKTAGALLETSTAIGTAIVSEVATSAVKSYNNIITGKHVSKQTKRTFFEELAKAKANTAKLKSLIVKEDEDNDLF
jgi:hypothetical protein